MAKQGTMTFGDVRSLLHSAVDRRAREAAWPPLLEGLVSAHKKKPSEVENEWLPYVLTALEDWPDELCVAPREWVNMLSRGIWPGLMMAIVRAIDVTRMNNPRFRSLCKQDGLQWVRHMTFGGVKMRTESIRALSQTKSLTGLKSLRFINSPIGSVRLHELCRAPFMDDLRKLSCISVQLNSDDVRVLTTKNSFEHLEVLDLSNNDIFVPSARFLFEKELPALRELHIENWYDPQTVEILLQSSWAPQLERLNLHKFIPPRRRKGQDYASLHGDVIDLIEQSSLRDETKLSAIHDITRHDENPARWSPVR